MKRILISGICGFAGSTVALRLRQMATGLEITGFDNFPRPGSELNRPGLKRHGKTVRQVDVRSTTDMEALPAVDRVVDAAANPRVSDMLRLAPDASRTEQLWDFKLATPAAAIRNEMAIRPGSIPIS
jgi:nucleoside-diphosphate-sugar epimerase